MPGQRQQRAQRNRRRVSSSTPQIATLLVTSVASYTIHTLTLLLSTIPQPPDGGGGSPQWFLSGIPSVLYLSGGFLPTAAIKTTVGSQDYLELTFPGPDIIPMAAFQIGPYDPALRTEDGGFLAPVQFQVA